MEKECRGEVEGDVGMEGMEEVKWGYAKDTMEIIFIESQNLCRRF
jgi:hypothetical protein